MGVERIDATDAFEKMEQGIPYLDVRTLQEYEAGHPAGSYHIPFAILDPDTGMMALNPDFLNVVHKSFDRKSPLMIGCKAGGRSAHAAYLLAQDGFVCLFDVGPGWAGGPGSQGMNTPGWKASNLPMNDGDGGERSYQSLLSGNK